MSFIAGVIEASSPLMPPKMMMEKPSSAVI